MYIVMVASECAPAAKVGGLGDVVHGLSRELGLRGHAVDIILPKYDCLRYDRIWGLDCCFADLWVPFYDQWIHCSVYSGWVDHLRCFFIEPHSHHNFFQRGVFYGQADDGARFGFFSRAALEFLHKSGRQPDIIHCHDWQTGLVPVLRYEMYQRLGMHRPRLCYTLHNLGHQGLLGDTILRQVGLSPGEMMTPDRLLDDHHRGAVNLMKGGIVYSNFVTTVSPRYANEVQNSHLGMGLQGVLHRHHYKFGGVLNGLDYSMWNPEIDRHLPERYSIDTLDRKYVNKKALRERLWLRHDFKPVVAFVGRLDYQKGIDLVMHAIPYCLANGCQFVLLGNSPHDPVQQSFWRLKHQYNEHPDCHLELSYNEELAHLIYAGSDMILVPSVYEPCGLTQVIGLKYGTVPVVRNTSGLADTVFDANFSSRPYHERNGYVFNDHNPAGLESALQRAIGMWHHYPKHFRELITNGMRYDFSWRYPGQHYVNIYQHIQNR
jgi:starch synthase